MKAKKRGLGKGLSALIANPTPNSMDAQPVNQASPSQESSTPVDGSLRALPVEHIQRGKYQPRKDMHTEALEELAASIKAQGVMQPIVVRPVAEHRYEIIAGERRWRASQMAGIHEIPAVIRTVSDEDAIAMALIENIQRENLNPIEEAVALQRLQTEFELTQQEVADAVGKNRATIANLLRLLALTPEVKTLLEHGDLEMGHARAMLSLDAKEQIEAARQVVQKGLTVRQTEALVRKLQNPQVEPADANKALDVNIRSLEDMLGKRLGAAVNIQHGNKGKGKLVIQYSSLDELDGILGHIK